MKLFFFFLYSFDGQLLSSDMDWKEIEHDDEAAPFLLRIYASHSLTKRKKS